MTPPTGSAISDPLHTSGDLTVTFANVNSAEAWGAGVASPLGWTFFENATELGMRRALADFGALRRREVEPPEDRNRRFLNVFYGRPGSNVGLWREVMDRIWGSSGAGYDESYHAGEKGSLGAARQRAGSAMSALRFLGVAVWSRVALARYRKEVMPWWRAAVVPGSTSTIAEAKAKFGEAADLNLRVIRSHAHASWVGQGLLEQLKARCEQTDVEGLDRDLIVSDDEFEEQALIEDLWEVSRDRLTLEHLLSRWGFQGPVVGELSSRSWREDPSPLMPIIAAYRRKPESESPAKLRGRRREVRRRAEKTLLEGRSPGDRMWTLLIARGARTFIPLRQVGRSTFLKTYDVARCMARRIGEQLVVDGTLDDPDDVFFLTETELLDGPPGNAREIVRFRRERRDHYRTVELPERWTGELTLDMVRPISADGADDTAGDTTAPGAQNRLEGLGVSSGVAEGRAIVVDRPDATYDLTAGDILVCIATDPSWAAILYAVDALVTDVGAQMSHGAIVARELGIPAVVNTRTGTKTLRTGDRIRVDGSTGVVDVLQRAPG